MDSRDAQNLPPLKDKDLSEESLTVFAVIVIPILTLFILVTCVFRCRRSKRKAVEQQEKAKKYESWRQTKATCETEHELPTNTHAQLETERATKGDPIPFDDRCKEQDQQELTINNQKSAGTTLATPLKAIDATPTLKSRAKNGEGSSIIIEDLQEEINPEANDGDKANRL